MIGRRNMEKEKSTAEALLKTGLFKRGKLPNVAIFIPNKPSKKSKKKEKK
jgi:hypothetical protein